jgi:tetratricopeptide (TPR) repeat protein
VTGWGAGSFAVVHLLYRHDRLGVQQPHSVPLQFLAETGIVGAAIALTALLLLALAAARVARRRALAADGLLAAAALMGGVAYLVHSLYDWDWDIPAVTLPALLLLGVLAGVAAKPRTPQLHRLGPAVGVGAVAGLTLWLFSFALSSALPSIAATEASSALVLAGDGSLNGAMSTAELASRLDPVSDAGLRVEAAVALRLGQVQAARRDLLEAVRREPSDGEAWQSLALVELASGDSRKAAGAAVRSLALDPQSRTRLASALTYSQRARLGSAPPQASATAIQTPSG